MLLLFHFRPQPLPFCCSHLHEINFDRLCQKWGIADPSIDSTCQYIVNGSKLTCNWQEVWKISLIVHQMHLYTNFSCQHELSQQSQYFTSFHTTAAVRYNWNTPCKRFKICQYPRSQSQNMTGKWGYCSFWKWCHKLLATIIGYVKQQEL